MRLTPRAEEVQVVVDILEAGDHDGPHDMARDIIKAVADFLWFREWYLLVYQYPDEPKMQFVWGPYASEAEAATHGRFAIEDGARIFVVKTRLIGKPDQREGGGFGYCCTPGCGHPAYGHSMTGPSRGHCVLCGTVEGKARCPKYEATKAKPKTTRSRKATS